MVPIYVSTLLPVFCHTFHSSMILSVKRASLGLVKKIIHYMDKNLLDATSNTDVAGHFFLGVNIFLKNCTFSDGVFNEFAGSLNYPRTLNQWLKFEPAVGSSVS